MSWLESTFGLYHLFVNIIKTVQKKLGGGVVVLLTSPLFGWQAVEATANVELGNKEIAVAEPFFFLL